MFVHQFPCHVLFYQSAFCPAIPCLSVLIKVLHFLCRTVHCLHCLFYQSQFKKNNKKNQSPRHTLSVCFIKVPHFYLQLSHHTLSICTVCLIKVPHLYFSVVPPYPVCFIKVPHVCCCCFPSCFPTVCLHCLFYQSPVCLFFSVVPPFTVCLHYLFYQSASGFFFSCSAMHCFMKVPNVYFFSSPAICCQF